MATIAWTSYFMHQPTGYGRVAREVLTRLQAESDHEILHVTTSGVHASSPFDLDGITVYGTKGGPGQVGIQDMQIVDQMADPDIWLWHFDAWEVGADLSNLGFEPVLYPPIDHEPLSQQWMPAVQAAREIVPFCQFGKRVLTDALAQAPDDLIREPIYHGVDPESFKPANVSPQQEGMAVDDDQFVVGIFKANQGTRWKPVRQLRAFKQFIDANGLHSEAMLYLHTNRASRKSFDLQRIISRLGLEGNVKLANPTRYRYGHSDEQLNRLYNACDVVLNATAGEGFGLPILEAMATETPVIVNGYSSMPELVLGEDGDIHYEHVEEPFVRGDRGYVIPVWDMEPTLGKHSWRRTNRMEHIALALQHAYNNPNELAEMGAAGREFAVQYDWDTIAGQWDDYFTDLENRTASSSTSSIDWGQVDTGSGDVSGQGK